MKACPKLDHMTHLGSMTIVLDVLRWLKVFFLQKPLTKDTAQRALILVFDKSANTLIAL